MKKPYLKRSQRWMLAEILMVAFMNPKCQACKKKILWKPLLCKMREIKMREIKFRAWRWSMSTRDMKELKALYGVSQSTLEACEVLLEVQDG